MCPWPLVVQFNMTLLSYEFDSGISRGCNHVISFSCVLNMRADVCSAKGSVRASEQVVISLIKETGHCAVYT